MERIRRDSTEHSIVAGTFGGRRDAGIRRMSRALWSFALVLVLCSTHLSAQEHQHTSASKPEYQRSDAPLEMRINDLLSRMTLEEKVHQLDLYSGAAAHKYVDDDRTPLFPFGFGLSYTTFRYDHLVIHAPEPGDKGVIHITVDVTNTGERDGDEVVLVPGGGLEPPRPSRACGF